MTNLTRDSHELFHRSPDERFGSLRELAEHCQQERQFSNDCWQLPQSLAPRVSDGAVTVELEGGNAPFHLNDWSFTQLCRLNRVSKDTLNRLTPETASQAFVETLRVAEKPIQLLTTGKTVRSVHGVAYTRLWNAELVQVLQEFATDFRPAPAGCNDQTGLYCGEQDLFAFLIDPTGWAEINGEAFAPGFFVWNSEVGRRSLGVQTFWFQSVCRNHIVWDAVEIVEFTRKHTANVHAGLSEIRRIIESLVDKRDERRDGFVRVLTKAMTEKLGSDAESVMKELCKNGIPRNLARDATALAEKLGGFTIFTLVDALTRMTQTAKFVGDRAEVDAKIGSLLSLAA
jgi:hypothetical protein